MSEAAGVQIVMSPDEYANGEKTCTVSLLVDGSPMLDADGPTFEYALMQLIHFMAEIMYKRGVEAEDD